VLRDGVAISGTRVQAEQPWADARLARLYDAFPFEADLPLYLELARTQGRRVLEVACGTGRVVVPLARAGFDVVGIDASAHMLAVAREKLDAEPELSALAGLVHADMRDFRLAEEAPFDLAVVAVKSFAYLTERQDQLRCLQAIAGHLRPGGLLAIDLLNPQPEWLGAARGSMRDDLLHQSADGRGITLWRVESVVSTDLARQVRTIRSVYECIDDRGSVFEKRFVDWPYRWTYRFEAEHLLERAGFAIEDLFGGYAGEPFTSNSDAMIFLARKPRFRSV